MTWAVSCRLARRGIQHRRTNIQLQTKQLNSVVIFLLNPHSKPFSHVTPPDNHFIMSNLTPGAVHLLIQALNALAFEFQKHRQFAFNKLTWPQKACLPPKPQQTNNYAYHPRRGQTEGGHSFQFSSDIVANC